MLVQVSYQIVKSCQFSRSWSSSFNQSQRQATEHAPFGTRCVDFLSTTYKDVATSCFLQTFEGPWLSCN